MIIAIAGGSGSGKTTISNLMKEKYKTCFNINVEVVSMDDYYKNIEIDSFDNYDHPNAFNIDQLHRDLQNFLSTGSLQTRSYNYETKESVALERKSNVKIVILEGLYSFYTQEIRDICHLKLFLDVDENIRIKQRLFRDLKERNISMEKNMLMINSFVKDMYKKHVLQQREVADKIYLNTNEVLSLIA